MDSRISTACLAAALLALTALPAAAQESSAAARSGQPHNVIIFVADGLRYGSVEPGNMPNMARLKAAGVDFTNSHSLYPTRTTVNASAIATGHYIGDTGDFGNTPYAGMPLIAAKGSPVVTLENDAVLDEMNQKFSGNYLNEVTLMSAARAKGWQTAVIGKEGPARIQDSTASADGSETLFLDDATGKDGGIGLPSWFSRMMGQAFIAPAAPANAVPNIEQEVWMAKAATRIVIPHFKESGKPFLLVFWSRDPDKSQHDGKDSIGEYDPGINGPSAKAGTRDADTVLGELLDALKEQGLDMTTDVFVTADHGFVTVSHASTTSPSVHFGAGLSDLPLGFLAIDLASKLGLPLHQPGTTGAALDFSNGAKPPGGAGALGRDPAHPDVVVTAEGGADVIYLPGGNAKALAGDIVNFLFTQDYVSGIFVRDDLGKFPGTLPMSAINMVGSAKTPVPAIYVNFRSFAGTCPGQLQCAVGVTDATQAMGQGNHGSLSRAETRNFMAAMGPDFKTRFADPAPISNADIAPTLAHIMGVPLPAKGKLTGRVISEALPKGAAVKVERQVIASDPGPGGLRTILDQQSVGETRYFDAAGFEGRTVGLTAH